MESIKTKKLHIAISGCVHGELKKLYSSLIDYEKSTHIKIDFIICTGDFQSLIKQSDLAYLDCPQKYKKMGDFQYYYNGKYEVPYLTIFIGGNHEASNILDDNFYGGWIMKNIFYLGRSGFIKVKGVNIAGLSGIFKINDYFKGHFERDISQNTKSIFHVREYDISKLSKIKSKIDFFISHDWPTGIVDKIDINDICRIKSQWRTELETNNLGSFPSEFLLRTLKPKFWICGHMHYYYKNTIYHNDNKDQYTKVIALDKCLNKRKFFDVIEYEINEEENDLFDNNLFNSVFIKNEWIAITKCFNQIYPVDNIYYDFSKFFEHEKQYENFLRMNGIKKYNYKNLQSFNEIIIDEFNKNLEETKGKQKTDKEFPFSTDLRKNSIVKIMEIEDIHAQNKSRNFNFPNCDDNEPGYHHNENKINKEEINLEI